MGYGFFNGRCQYSESRAANIMAIYFVFLHLITYKKIHNHDKCRYLRSYGSQSYRLQKSELADVHISPPKLAKLATAFCTIIWWINTWRRRSKYTSFPAGFAYQKIKWVFKESIRMHSLHYLSRSEAAAFTFKWVTMMLICLLNWQYIIDFDNVLAPCSRLAVEISLPSVA